jgi:hypothetical protein
MPLAHNWSLTAVWTLATAGALVLTTLVVELLFLPFLGFLLLPLAPLAGVMFGFSVGALQWLVLRRVVPDAGYWILVTGFAFGFGWPLAIAGFYVMRGALPIVAGAVGAGLIGCAQAMLLKRWSRRARVWVAASIAGWTAATAVLLFGPRTVPGLSGPADSLVSWAAGFNTQSAVGSALLAGLVAGGITGTVLPWILEGKGPAIRETAR